MLINGEEVNNGDTWKCPKCGDMILCIDGNGFPAVSRDDDKTDVCSDCGRNEALTSFLGFV